jgi:hypothetical protein
MPWHVGKSFAVIKDGTTEVVACHPTQAAAQAQVRALYANEGTKEARMPDMAVKFVDGTDGMLEGLGIPFGGPVGGSDVHGERFHKGTDIAEEWFPNEGRPFLFHHGLDPEAKAELMGRQVEREVRDTGHWVKVQLDKRSKYMSALQELVDQQALSFSSGAYPHLVRTRKDGTIDYWPVVEFSGTPTPANVMGDIYAVKGLDAVEHIAAIHTDVPTALKSALTFPGEGGLESEPFADQATRITGELEAFAERAELRGDWRAKAGRPLSAANRAEIAAILDGLKPFGETYTRLTELLARTDPEADAAKAAAAVEFLRYQRELARQNGVNVPVS